jgi:hypothetical protein
MIRLLDNEQLSQYLLAPTAILAPLLEQGKAYQDWLTARCAMLRGWRAPFVATHNDLTMWNILLDEQGGIGVVDWETASAQGFPLVDFFYAVTDAVAAVRGYVDRPQAFAACFAPRGSYEHVVGRLLRRFRHAVEIPDAIADLCFHACWLHHAVNEHHSSGSSAPRPFFKIMQWLVLHRFYPHRWRNA